MKKKVVLLLVLMMVLKTEAQSSVFSVVDSLLLKGAYKKALNILEVKDSKDGRVCRKIGDIYQSVGNYSKAIEHFNDAIKVEDNDVNRVKLARVYETSGHSNKAIEIYESLIVKDSSNLLALHSLGKLYLVNSNPKRAGKIFRFLLSKDSLNSNYHYLIGQSLMKQGKKFEMADAYLDAYKVDSLHIKSIYRLAKFFKSINDKDSTGLFIEKGLKIDSNNVNFLQLKANYLYTSKDYRGAINQLKRLDSLDYRSANIYEMFGLSYAKLNDLDSAEIYFKKGLRLESKSAALSFRLAKLYYNKEDLKKAKFFTEMAVYHLKPEYDEEYYLLGIIHKELGEDEVSIKYFEIAYRNNFKNYDALFQLALVSERYYKDKKIALDRYRTFIDRFEDKDKTMSEFVKGRITILVKERFLEGKTREDN